MGQPVTVERLKSSASGMLRFEINRSLTGMGHERYLAAEDAGGPRPVDELARRLFALGGIEAVHVNSNMITIDPMKGTDGDQLVPAIEDLFLFWQPGMVPPTDEEVIAAAKG
jgi:hypothetical protein